MRYEDGNRLTENEITGLLISAIFAGHHTSSATAAWVMVELLKHAHVIRDVRAELDRTRGDVTWESLRDTPLLENAIKEVLRLHPPLTILMRKAIQDLAFDGYTIKAGTMIWTCPPVTHRMAGLFANPTVFDPDRFSPARREDKNAMAYQPFGGGTHRCSGNSFAIFQIKAIFASLLRRYDFELVTAPETYVDNYAEMIVRPRSPCRVRYRVRQPT
jgi:sterol 14-demethylase